MRTKISLLILGLSLCMACSKSNAPVVVQGTETHGGDGTILDFLDYGKEIVAWIRENGAKYKLPFTAEQFEAKLLAVKDRVQTTNVALFENDNDRRLDVNEKDALNYPQEVRIDFNKKRLGYITRPRAKLLLYFHEIAGLMGFDRNYEISSLEGFLEGIYVDDMRSTGAARYACKVLRGDLPEARGSWFEGEALGSQIIVDTSLFFQSGNTLLLKTAARQQQLIKISFKPGQAQTPEGFAAQFEMRQFNIMGGLNSVYNLDLDCKALPDSTDGQQILVTEGLINFGTQFIGDKLVSTSLPSSWGHQLLFRTTFTFILGEYNFFNERNEVWLFDPKVMRYIINEKLPKENSVVTVMADPKMNVKFELIDTITGNLVGYRVVQIKLRSANVSHFVSLLHIPDLPGEEPGRISFWLPASDQAPLNPVHPDQSGIRVSFPIANSLRRFVEARFSVLPTYYPGGYLKGNKLLNVGITYNRLTSDLEMEGPTIHRATMDASGLLPKVGGPDRKTPTYIESYKSFSGALRLVPRDLN